MFYIERKNFHSHYDSLLFVSSCCRICFFLKRHHFLVLKTLSSYISTIFSIDIIPLPSAIISRILFFGGLPKYFQTSEKYECWLKNCFVRCFMEFSSFSDSVAANSPKKFLIIFKCVNKFNFSSNISVIYVLNLFHQNLNLLYPIQLLGNLL